MSHKIPEALIDLRVYLDDVNMLGIADAELPDLEAMTETVSGSGIMGEVDAPILGQYGSLTVKLKFRTLTNTLAALKAPGAHLVTLRGAIQINDAGTGALTPVGVKCVVRGRTKKAGLGKLESAKPMDNEVEIEAAYLKLSLNEEEIIELDKYNYILKINGEDHMAPVRQQLGMET